MTASQKLFSKASTESSSPNTSVSLFDAAIPGTLPKLNVHCIELATKAALALDSNISSWTCFDRKHYFYPDLPNGYQITQHFYPFASGGKLKLQNRFIGIEQIQIEQDSAKTVQGISGSLVDLNRAGIGILEIVTKPELSSSTETVAFLKKLQHLLWHVGVSIPDMDDGAFRCDVNVSIHQEGEPLGNRVELKHLHKFSSIKLAVDYEISRQTRLVESGQTVLSETRGFDSEKLETFALREKEGTHEYYFMQDANIPRIRITEEYIDRVKARMPEDLDQRKNRLLNEYQLDTETVEILMNRQHAVEYFERTRSLVPQSTPPKRVANWVVIELFGHLNRECLDLDQSPVDSSRLAALITLITTNRISQLQAKNVLWKMMTDSRNPEDIAREHGLLLDDNNVMLRGLCETVIQEHPLVVSKIKNGKPKLVGFLVGQVMQKKKTANPKVVSDILVEILKIN